MGAEGTGHMLGIREVMLDAPGYDPLDLRGDAPEGAVPPSQLLVSLRQEIGRGGSLEITEYVSPAPDVAMHFRVPVTGDGIERNGVADVLATTSFYATLTYHGAPESPTQSGTYFWLPPINGRHSYALDVGELLVGWPEVHAMPEPTLRQLTDSSDVRSTEANRVVTDLNQLSSVIGLFGLALGLDRSDRTALANNLVLHTNAARAYRSWQNLSEAIGIAGVKSSQ